MCTEYEGVIYLVFGSLSVVSGVTVIIVYVLTGNWKEPPAMLIFWHLISQCFIDATISATGFSCIIHQEPIDRWCKSLGASNIFFYFLSFNYIVCLCLEVLLKLDKPMENSYNKRAKAYHIVSHSLSLALVLYLYMVHESGPSFNNFCFIKKDSEFHYMSLIPLFIFLPFLVQTYFKAFKMRTTTTYVNFFVKKHLIYITVYFFIWLPIILNNILHNRLKVLSLMLTSSSGFIMTSLRVGSVFYAKYLKKSNRACTNKISIASMINETLKENPEARLLDEEYGVRSDYIGVFYDVSKESALTALVIFHYSMLFTYQGKVDDEPPWESNYYKDKRTIKIEKRHLDLIVLPQSLKPHFSNLSLEYTEYSTEVFKSIMDIESITFQDLINSFNILSILSNFSSIAKNSGGRSSSFFLYSSDKKYIIKTISNKELKVLLSDFLISYHTHLYKNQDSVICRILGAYSFQVNSNYTVHFIVMQSVYTEFSLKAVYDLKGSKLNRNVKTEDKKEVKEKIVFKDINFLTQEKTMKMPPSVAQRMKEIIKIDAELFPKFNIMDYSLLVAVKNKQEYSKYFFRSANCKAQGYSIGIIDFLQRYNKTKQIEGISKKIMNLSNSEKVSSINSEDYCKRFLKFVFKIIEEVC